MTTLGWIAIVGAVIVVAAAVVFVLTASSRIDPRFLEDA